MYTKHTFLLRKYKDSYDVLLLDNYVDGQVLFQLSEKDLLDIIQPIGIVKNIMALVQGDQVC